MEYIVLAATPGIPTQELLNLFNTPNGETIFISFSTLNDKNLTQAPSSSAAARIVFHGEYDTALIKLIHTVHPTTKNILLFNTADAALLHEIIKLDESFSVEACIDNWSNSIRQLSLLAEKSPESSALIEYSNLARFSVQTIALVNKRLGVQLNDNPIITKVYSGIVRLIAAAALINNEDALVLYDDAKTLELTSHYDSNYTDAISLIAKHQPAALKELNALQKFMRDNSTTGNIALALENKQSELEIALLQIQQLQEELEAAQINIKHMQQEINRLTNICQQNDKNQKELDIALLQLNQLQQELENTMDKYGELEHSSANSVLVDKILCELPLLTLLRTQNRCSTHTN